MQVGNMLKSVFSDSYYFKGWGFIFFVDRWYGFTGVKNKQYKNIKQFFHRL